MVGNKGIVPHPLSSLLRGHRVILGSQSPRRVTLLRELGLDFEVRPSHADESHPENVSPRELPLILAKRKAEALRATCSLPGDLLITADTIVDVSGKILEKPHDITEAKEFLKLLSGRWHTVHSGFCLRMDGREVTETVHTDIHFSELSDQEIDYYITRSEVLDKAGAYGIQDWIGLACIDEIKGSYNNVIGLPTATLYRTLKAFLLA